MFEITKFNTIPGLIVVEDREMGLSYDFQVPSAKSARVVNDYDLEVITRDDSKLLLRILA